MFIVFWFFLSKTTEARGETFHNPHFRKAAVTTAKPAAGVGVPSWFHFPVGLDVCQCDAMGVGGTGGWCQLLPQGWDVVVDPRSVHCYPEESAGR